MSNTKTTGQTAASAIEKVDHALDVIREREPVVAAWTHLDERGARARAQALDTAIAGGALPGVMHGVPVAVKDIIDTADMPTQNGCAADAGRQPSRDACIVNRLRAAGAVNMGKSVTTELANRHPGKTTNPHNPAHTPGGSSSGSAAAVACGMVPVAIGTQTGGSVIRPAAFCGVIGYKPTFGWIPRSGVLCQSHSLDTVGFFAKSIHDVALIGQVCTGRDAGDPGSIDQRADHLVEVACSKPPRAPRLGFAGGPAWDSASEDTHHLLPGFAEQLDSACEPATLPPGFDQILDAHAAVQFSEMANHFGHYVERSPASVSESMQEAVQRGRQVSAVAYQRALALRDSLNEALAAVFARYDALLVPAAAGEAPEGLDWTGDPAFNAPWTLLGLPCVTVPLLSGGNGLPIGVQLVGARNDDARLLRTANWLMNRSTT